VSAPEVDLTPWSACRTLANLGQVTARWLRGELSYFPGHNDPHEPPLPESKDLLDVLVALNGAGYITTNSQPGQSMTRDGNAQRAFVRGYCSEDTFQRIDAALYGTELVALPRPPGMYHLCPVPITTVGGKNFTWAGMSSGEPEAIAREFGGALSEEMVSVLAGGWLVDVLDPVWGRTNLLWSKLQAGLVPPGDRR
jgi:hypothetical protein